MAKSKLVKWQILCVTWEDAYGAMEAIPTDRYLLDYIPCVRKTLGFYLGETNGTGGRIFIAETDDREANTPEDADRVTVIPTGMIRKIQILK